MARAAFGNRTSAAGVAANAAAAKVAASGGSKEAQLAAGRAAATVTSGGTATSSSSRSSSAPVAPAPVQSGFQAPAIAAGPSSPAGSSAAVAAARSVGAFGNRTSAAGIAANQAAAQVAASGGSKTDQLAAGNAAAKAMLSGAPPEVQQQFQQYNDFLNQLDQMPEDQRNQALQQIEQQAASVVDPYYDQQQGFNDEERALLQKQFVQKRDASISAATIAHDRGIEDLTKQTSGALSDSESALRSRGAFDNSGLEKTYADQLIEARTQAAGRADQDLSRAKDLANQGFDISQQVADLSGRRTSSVLSQNRQYDTGLQQNDILGDLERFNYLMTGSAASIPFQGSPPPITSQSSSSANTAATSSSVATARAEQSLNRNLTTTSAPISAPPRTSGKIDQGKLLVDLRTRTYSAR